MKISISNPEILFFDPNIYSSFPDIVKLSSCYLAVYREGDEHHPKKSSLILLKSTDGKTWTRKEFQSASLEEQGYVFNCPRLSTINNRVVLSCDIKSSQKEGKSKWSILLWWSKDQGDTWTPTFDTRISGMVPDKIISVKNKLILGYHIIENMPVAVESDKKEHRLVQMMAESYDGGATWRDRTTIAVSNKHDFCEGSIVPVSDVDLICYMRDNKGAKLRSQFCISKDTGKTWTPTSPAGFIGHRIVAGIKKREPYSGLVVGTFRNTVNKTVSLFLQNTDREKTQIFTIDTETNGSIYNYGYTGWCENLDGSLKIINYITRNKPNPEIYTIDVKLL